MQVAEVGLDGACALAVRKAIPAECQVQVTGLE
jgi:hypothetical protein